MFLLLIKLHNKPQNTIPCVFLKRNDNLQIMYINSTPDDKCLQCLRFVWLIKWRQGSPQGVTILALGNSRTDIVEYVQCHKCMVMLRAHNGLFGYLFGNYSCLSQHKEWIKNPICRSHERWFTVCRDDSFEVKTSTGFFSLMLISIFYIHASSCL